MIVIGLLAVASFPAAVSAGQVISFNVTKTADTNDGHCNSDRALREAISAANASSVAADGNIPNPGTYKLTRKGRNEDMNATGDLDIRAGMRIQAAGARNVIIDGNGIDRVFDIPDATITTAIFISDLTITGGKLALNTTSSGGGLEVKDDSAFVYLNGLTIRGNSAPFGAGVQNGLNEGPTMYIDNTTISGNTASNAGGGIVAVGDVTITNSTISGNHARIGGGIYAYSGNTSLHYSTVAFNTATMSGGGIGEQSGSVTSVGTIIAKNTIGTANSNCAVTIGSGGYNLENGPVTSCGLEESTDRVGNPKLAALGNYGGPTNTHKLLKGSPAINHGGTSGIPNYDQRGFDRPHGTAADIGSYEK